MSHDDYAVIEAANWSIIKLMDSPKIARWTLDNPKQGDSASRGMLRAAHCLALEPHNFDRDFVVYGGRRDKRTKAYQAFLASSGGRTILSESEHSSASAIADAAREHPVAGPILSRGESEITLVWHDSETGTKCKGRAAPLDIDHEAKVVWVDDLKTVKSADNGELGRMAARMGWLGQFAHYVDGVRSRFPGYEVRARIIAVEGSAPHDVGVFLLDDAALNAGETKRRPLLDRYAECSKTGRWPGRHEDQAVWLDLPDYVFPTLDAEGFGMETL